jgi:hypothetical protein
MPRVSWTIFATKRIEAEQKAANRCDAADQHDVDGVGLLGLSLDLQGVQ